MPGGWGRGDPLPFYSSQDNSPFSLRHSGRYGHRGMMRKLLCDIHEVPADGELCLPSQLGRDLPAAPSM